MSDKSQSRLSMPKGNTRDRKERPNDTGKKRALGHELPLSSFTAKKVDVRFGLTTGENVIGKVHSFDKWTVTLDIEGTPHPVTYFKHALLSFQAV